MYCKELTKEFLINCGITNVDICGNVWVNGKLKFPRYNCGYYKISVYSSYVYSQCEIKTRQSGTLTFPVQRIVWAWFNGKVPAGMVVDHINNNKLDNNLNNLQLLTPQENLNKDKPSTRILKCKLDRQLSYYTDKLEKYLYQYELAKKSGLQELAHKLRSNISQTKARIRYWKLNNKEQNNETI